MRLAIVNADDFGFSHGVNRGIMEAHERGIVTSASLMVGRPGAAEAAEYARARATLGVGLHVELGRWRVGLLPHRGAARSEGLLRRRAAAELSGQLERFRALLGRDPSHLDSHQHRHRAELVRPLFEQVAGELGVPLRRIDPRVRFCGDFYGHDARGRPEPESITTESLLRVFHELEEGVTEVCCHPGYADGLADWYREEREVEIRALCDPRVREAVARLGIRLGTFSELDSVLTGGRERT